MHHKKLLASRSSAGEDFASDLRRNGGMPSMVEPGAFTVGTGLALSLDPTPTRVFRPIYRPPPIQGFLAMKAVRVPRAAFDAAGPPPGPRRT